MINVVNNPPPTLQRPRRRPGQEGGRSRTVGFALTEAEYAEVCAAAGRAGLARGAFAAEAALAVARGRVLVQSAAVRDAVHALDRAATLARGIGVNLNQAVARLHLTGQVPGDLASYAAQAIGRAAKLEEAGHDLHDMLTRPADARQSSKLAAEHCALYSADPGSDGAHSAFSGR